MGMVVSGTDGMIGKLYYGDFNVSANEISLSSDEEWMQLYGKLSAEKERRDNLVTNLYSNYWKKKSGSTKRKKPVKILVTVANGQIQSIQSSAAGAEAVIIDYDWFYAMDPKDAPITKVAPFTKVKYMGNHFSGGIKAHPDSILLTSYQEKVKAYLRFVEAIEKLTTKREDMIINAIRLHLKGDNMAILLSELTAICKQHNGGKLLKQSIGPNATSKLKSLIKLSS